jgi:hypothetical protein
MRSVSALLAVVSADSISLLCARLAIGTRLSVRPTGLRSR